MLILGKIKVNNKWKIREIESLIKTFSMFYVKDIFNKSKYTFYRSKVENLLKIQNYIKQYYNINIPIYKLILNILHNIKINNTGLLYIKKEQINTIKISEIYRLVTFGNLQVQKNAIFKDAINFGIKYMRIMKQHGC